MGVDYSGKPLKPRNFLCPDCNLEFSSDDYRQLGMQFENASLRIVAKCPKCKQHSFEFKKVGQKLLLEQFQKAVKAHNEGG